MRTLIFVIAAIMLTGIVVSCDSGSDETDGNYSSYVFVNNTGDRVEVYRDGGPAWSGDENFALGDRGDEHTVVLRDGPGSISYRWFSTSGDIRIVTSGNQIIFEN